MRQLGAITRLKSLKLVIIVYHKTKEESFVALLTCIRICTDVKYTVFKLRNFLIIYFMIFMLIGAKGFKFYIFYFTYNVHNM